MKIWFKIAVLCFGLSHSADAAQPSVPEQTALSAGTTIDLPAIDYRIIDQGGPRLVTTDWGYLGHFGRQLIDSATGEILIPLEYPGLSGITYLYSAGLWIGGVVDGDTLVSTGSLSSWARHEFFPDSGSGGGLSFDDYLADEGYRATYYDTITTPGIAIPDGIDGPHQPLNVSVGQLTQAWADTIYSNLIWMRLTITNLGDQTIANAFIGWQLDPDVHHLDTRAGYTDDLAGYREGSVVYDGVSYPVAGVYTIDNDGDPDTLMNFTSSSPTGAFGLAYLSGYPEAESRSFNWWVYNYYLELDWGPHYPPTDSTTPDLSGGPQGDRARYAMMANGEIDYDQVFAAVDKTAEGWAPPADTTFFAAGYDIRYLYSVGPYTILPGDSVLLNFGWFIGPEIHPSPDHFSTTFSAAEPEVYLSGLDFSGWDHVLAAARQLESSNFALAAPGPPDELTVDSWTPTQTTLSWRNKGTFDLAGYEIFQRLVADDYPPTPIAVVPATASTFTDDGLLRDKYDYRIRSFDDGDRRGALSASVESDLRRPMPVQLLEVIPAGGMLTLAWLPSAYTNVTNYYIDRYQISVTAETTMVQLGQTTAAFFSDPDPEEVILYEYVVTSESDLGLLGPPSNKLPGMVMAFDGGPLVIDQTLRDPSGLTDKDSVLAFWRRMLPTATLRDEDRAEPSSLQLFDFNAHPVTIVVSSGDFSETEQLHEMLKSYFLAGGNVLLVGRDLFNTTGLPHGSQYFGDGDLAYDYFGVTRIHYPVKLFSHPTRMNAEFIGATACGPELPDMFVDSGRTDWGVPSPLQPVGPGIPFVGWLEGDAERTECLYTYQSLYSDTSLSQSKTIGLFYDNGFRRTVVLNFPLSMMEEGSAQTALDQLVTLLGQAINRPGDFNGDGQVNPVDVVSLIFYLLRNGDPPLNPRNVDLNTDCLVNLVDVVILVNYVYRNGPPPAVGCIQDPM